MLFFAEDAPDFPMSSKKEKTMTIRCDAATKAAIYRSAGSLDTTVSGLLLACCLAAESQAQALPILLTLGLKDIRPAGERP